MSRRTNAARLASQPSQVFCCSRQEAQKLATALRNRFEKENELIQAQIEKDGRIRSPRLAEEFANLTFAGHPDVVNRDYTVSEEEEGRREFVERQSIRRLQSTRDDLVCVIAFGIAGRRRRRESLETLGRRGLI